MSSSEFIIHLILITLMKINKTQTNICLYIYLFYINKFRLEAIKRLAMSQSAKAPALYNYIVFTCIISRIKQTNFSVHSSKKWAKSFQLLLVHRPNH